jgi:hypothetical protein
MKPFFVDNIVSDINQDLIQDIVIYEKIVDWRLLFHQKDQIKQNVILSHFLIHDGEVKSNLYTSIHNTGVIVETVSKVKDAMDLWSIQTSCIDMIISHPLEEYTSFYKESDVILTSVYCCTDEPSEIIVYKNKKLQSYAPVELKKGRAIIFDGQCEYKIRNPQHNNILPVITTTFLHLDNVENVKNIE